MKLLSTFLLSSLLTTTNVVQAQDFTALSNPVSGEIKGVILPAACGLAKKVPNAMYTIEPASGDTVVVLTTPPDLVTATVDAGKLLTVRFNKNVAPNATEGGVKIQIPDAQFTELTAQASSPIQIMTGFTSLAQILSTSSASVSAVLGTGAVPLTLDVSSSAAVDVQFDGGEIERAGVSSSGILNVVASTVKAVEVDSSGMARLNVQNPIGSGMVSSSGQLHVSANEGCNNLEIDSSGMCMDGQDVGVSSVVVGEPYTMTGQVSCNGYASTNTYHSGAFSSFGATGKFLAVAATAWLVTLF